MPQITEFESREVGSDDSVHARLKEVLEVSETACLWTPSDAITFTPRVLDRVYGDGRALFWLMTINQRPAYWIIRGDSGWSTGADHAPTEAPYFAEFSDDFLTDLEAQFGNGRCGYSGGNLFYPKEERECDCEECDDEYVAEWPMVDGSGGCSWGRLKWPDGIPAVDHPWAWRGNLLAPEISGADKFHTEAG